MIFFPGDEIVAVNSLSLQGRSHDEAIAIFRAVKNGRVVIHYIRREGTRWAQSCGIGIDIERCLSWAVRSEVHEIHEVQQSAQNHEITVRGGHIARHDECS